jgi:hypothetical protein
MNIEEPTFKPLVELSFDIDPEAPERDREDVAAGEILDDATIDLMRKENRVGLARGVVTPVTGPTVPAGRAVVDIPLLFVLQAHPECTYRWCRIVIDLTPTETASVRDMSPRGVEDIAVDVETTVATALGFKIAAAAVDLSAKPELTRKRTVFMPTVASSGVGFRKAYWDFYPKGGDYLHADKELHLLVDAPESVPVMAAVSVRARVQMKGFLRLIPLVGKTGGVSVPDAVRLA